MKPKYCTQNHGNCETCSLVENKKDCKGKALTENRKKESKRRKQHYYDPSGNGRV